MTDTGRVVDNGLAKHSKADRARGMHGPEVDNYTQRLLIILLAGTAISTALYWPASAQRRELHPTPEQREILREEILRAGFECPSLNLLHTFGMGPRGAILRAWCGPPGTSNVYTRLVYRLDLQQMPGGLTRVWVRPWEGDPHRAPER